MKSRLLAAFLSISMLFGSIPVSAAEPAGMNVIASESAAQEETTESKISKDTTGNIISTEGDASSEDASVIDGDQSDSPVQGTQDGTETDTQDSTGTNAEDGTGVNTETGTGTDTGIAPPANENGTDNETATDTNIETGNGNNENETTDTPASDDNSDNTDAENGENPSDDAIGEDNTDSEAYDNEEAEEETIIDDPAAEPLYDVSEADATALSYEGNNELTLVSFDYESSVNWYSFTAPENGYYAFRADSDSYSYSMYLYERINDYNPISYMSNNYMDTDYMTAGDKIYIQAYKYSDEEEITVNLTIHKLDSYNGVRTEEGSYSFDTDDYTLSVSTKAGYGTLVVDADLAAKDTGVLENSYRLLSAYEKTNGNDYTRRKYSSLSFYSYNDYHSKLNMSVDSGEEYKLYFLLLDNSNNFLGRFDADIVLSTEYTSEPVAIHDTTATESSITFDIEFLQYISYCYYAPTANPEETQQKSLYSKGWEELSFTGLQPATEYSFQFTNSSGKVIFEATASTAESTTTADYSAVFNADGNLKLSVDVSDYKGDASYAYLHYEFVNTLGESIHDFNSLYSINTITPDENGAKSFAIDTTLTSSNLCMLADTQYDINMWVIIGNMTLPKVVKKVTTPPAAISASAVSFDVELDEGTESSAKCTVGITDLASNISGKIYYRQKGDKSYALANVSLSASSNPASVSIGNLCKGLEYEYVLLIGGIKKELSKTLGTADAKLVKVGDGETNAFDIVRTYKVDSAETLTGNYTLGLAYWNANSKSYSQLGSNASLNADNEYQETIKTALARRLDADTDYDLKWTLYDTSGNIADVVYEPVHTIKPRLTLAKKDSKASSQEYQVSLDARDTANFESSASVYLDIYAFVRKKGSIIYHQADSESLYSYNQYSATLSFNDLDPSTEYEVSIRSSNNSSAIEYAADSFTTAEDARTIRAEVSASYTTAKINLIFNGNDNREDSYLYLFYRAKGSHNWISDWWSTENTDYNITTTISPLTSDTTYEYYVVISNEYGITDPAQIADGNQKFKGEFTTKVCNYELEFALDEAESTHNKAVVSVTLKNANAEDERIRAILILNNRQQQTVTLKKSDNYKNDVEFTNLASNTQYTIVNAVFYALEGTSYVEAGEGTYNFEFTTKAAEKPTSITLSEKELCLNAAYSGVQGISVYTLKAEVAPASASAEFEWESSDSSVASVYNGTVYAQGVGSAVITVKSKLDSDISAICTVTVEKYAVGCKVGDGDLNIPAGSSSSNRYSVYKGRDIEGLGLYKYNEEGSTTLLSDYTVTSARPEIISWGDGKASAKAVGSTYLTFEKDGFKAQFYVSVSAEGKGFGVKNITTSNNNYPAIKESGESYTLAYTPGISYTANVEVAPKQNSYQSDFRWTISNTDIAQVSDTGVITPKSKGDVELTIEPLNRYTDGGVPYNTDSVKLTLHIKDLPISDSSSLSALANVDSKIGDIKFPLSWGDGWSWKYPDTPFVTNAVYSNNVYWFDAIYNGSEYYPCETTLAVSIGRITGVSVSETMAQHNNVLEAGNNDEIILRVSPVTQGSVFSADYETSIPDVNGLTITKNDNGTFSIKNASKKGNYTLKPVIKAAGSDKVLATGSYKIKVVEDKQVGSITLTTETEGVTINSSTNTIIFATEDAKKDFVLKAAVKDRYGEDSETALTWKTTDKTVATAAPVSKTDTHSANIKVKGSGHTVIMVNAKDSAGYLAKLNLEVQDHTPRVDTAKASVNIAYDYDNYKGEEYAYNSGGAVEIVPVYGESISSIELRDQSGAQKSADLDIEHYTDRKYLVKPLKSDLTKGTYNCTIFVKTNTSGDDGYKFPLKVTVTDKAPSVSATMSDAPNLFFKNSGGYINLKISGGYHNAVDSSSVVWEDESTGVENGFRIASSGYINSKKVARLYVSQQSGLKVANAKLSDASVAKGKLSFKINGFKEPYEFKNFKIKYKYKKPALTAQNPGYNVVPSVGQNRAYFEIWDKTNKRYLYYYSSAAAAYHYDEYKYDSDEVTLSPSGYYVNYTYNGQGNKKVNLTLDSLQWREPLSVSYTIKTIKPKAYLEYKQLIFNNKLKSTLTNYIKLKNANNINYSNIEIKGANAKSQKLLDDDLFVISSSGNSITVAQSQADFMGAEIPTGVYSYKVTPSYIKPDTGETAALNTLTFKIKVINKDVTAKVSPKGTFDLTAYRSSDGYEQKNLVVLVNPKFSNMVNGYTVSNYELVGEYSDYFTLYYGDLKYNNKYIYNNYYIRINSSSPRKLKAKQSYKLAIKYTIENNNNESFVVTSNTFTIKPKQSTPKVTVTNNNQTLYAAAKNLTRTYKLSAPYTYSISSVSAGGIDVNKDGTNDISISYSGSDNVTVRINDMDAVLAASKGKSYNIPITVKLTGRDGIVKDAKTTIKVKVKR